MARPLLGTAVPLAFSSAMLAAVAWAVGHTPQMRCTIWEASRGFRPRRMASNPRNMPPVIHASATFPSSTCTSTLRCPSSRVTGSMAITVLLMLPPGDQFS